jgi:hypothetical protein
MADLTLDSRQVANLVEHLVTVFGAAGGSVLGAEFSTDGSILTIGRHTTIGYENESLDGWASHPLQLKSTKEEVNQIQNENIRLDMSSFKNKTMYILAKPGRRGERRDIQPAEVELVDDLLNRSMDGLTKLSVLLGSCVVDGDGLLVSTDDSTREIRVDNIQEIIDVLNSTGVLDHASLLNLGAPADDHTQYFHIDGRRALTGDLNAGSNLLSNLAAPVFPAPVTDHGGLTGLGDDDHTIYLKADGLRPLSGTWSVGSERIINAEALNTAEGTGGGQGLMESLAGGLTVNGVGNSGAGAHPGGTYVRFYHDPSNLTQRSMAIEWFDINGNNLFWYNDDVQIIDATASGHSIHLVGNTPQIQLTRSGSQVGTIEPQKIQLYSSNLLEYLELDGEVMRLSGSNTSGHISHIQGWGGTSAPRIWTLPDNSGTVALVSDLLSFPLQGPNGNGAAPSYSFSGNTATGMYRSGSGLTEKVHLGVSGQSNLEVNATGEVVIGFGRIDHTAKGVGLRLTGDNGGGTDRTIELKAAQNGSFVADLTLTLPPTGGTVGQVLKTTGGASASLYWDGIGGGGDFLADGTVSMTGTFKAVDGGSGAPGVTFASDQTTGMYRAASTLGFGIGGAAKLTLFDDGLDNSATFTGKIIGEQAVFIKSGTAFSHQLTGTPTADRTITFQDADGTVVMSTGQSYTVTNAAADRAYDANATTLDEVADVLGTLISDLQSSGIIS